MIPHWICMAIISLKIDQVCMKNWPGLYDFLTWHIHSLISGANCFILQIPMLYLGFFTLDVHIITLGFTSGNNVNVSGK